MHPGMHPHPPLPGASSNLCGSSPTRTTTSHCSGSDSTHTAHGSRPLPPPLLLLLASAAQQQAHVRQAGASQLRARQLGVRQLGGWQLGARQLGARQLGARQLGARQEALTGPFNKNTPTPLQVM